MSVEGLMLDLGMNLELKKGTAMKYVYIVHSKKNGFVFGVYANHDDAHKVFMGLIDEYTDLRLSTEPVIQNAAHYKP